MPHSRGNDYAREVIGLWSLPIIFHPCPPVTAIPAACETSFYSLQEPYPLLIHAQSSESYHPNQTKCGWHTLDISSSCDLLVHKTDDNFAVPTHTSLGLASHSHIVLSQPCFSQDTNLCRIRFKQHRNVQWAGVLPGLATHCPCR